MISILFVVSVVQGHTLSGLVAQLEYYPMNSPQTWIVLYYDQNVELTKSLMKDYIRIAADYKHLSNLKFGRMNCAQSPSCESEETPILKLFCNGFVLEYDGELNSDLVTKWINSSLTSKYVNIKNPPMITFPKSENVPQINETFLSSLNKSNDDWVIFYFGSNCRTCRSFLRTFYEFADRIVDDPHVKFGIVICPGVGGVSPEEQKKIYGKKFHKWGAMHQVNSAREILPVLSELFNFHSVCDVGCGNGGWLRACHEFVGINNSDLVGFDFEVPLEELVIEHWQYRNADISQRLACERKFDMCISLEVAEHISPNSADVFVQNLVFLSPVILFSAAIPQQGGTNHVNEQWPTYWEKHFKKYLYHAVDYLRFKFWNNHNVNMHYRQNMVLFVREDKLSFMNLSTSTEPLLSMVHPLAFHYALNFLRHNLKKRKKKHIQVRNVKKASTACGVGVNSIPVIKLFREDSLVVYSEGQDTNALIGWLDENKSRQRNLKDGSKE